MTTCAFASAAESELPSWLAIPWTELVNALVAASASLRRSLLRSPCAASMFFRLVLISSPLGALIRQTLLVASVVM